MTISLLQVPFGVQGEGLKLRRLLTYHPHCLCDNVISHATILLKDYDLSLSTNYKCVSLCDQSSTIRGVASQAGSNLFSFSFVSQG